MLKRRDWLRKAQKRLIQKHDRGIVDFMKISYHFFRGALHMVQPNGRTACKRILSLHTSYLCDDGAAEKCLRAKKYAFHGRKF